MQILLNGSPTQTAAQNVLELLHERDISQVGVAVALNGRVVRRAEHASQPLQNGDKIEIIRAVQGG